MSNETAKCNKQPATERSCPDPAGSRPIQAKMPTGKMDGDDIYAQEIKEWRKARFHTWCKQYPCAIGDGSMIHERTLAIIEMEDGRVEYVEPHNIHFENVERDHPASETRIPEMFPANRRRKMG